MLNLTLFLHFYQPPTQFPEITKKIAHQSYEKILEILENNGEARLTVNFPASLVEQLERVGLSKIVSGFAGLVEKGRIELTGSAAYHPLLPKIPQEEMVRQIRLNEEINKKCFGKAWQPRGFFPPEMAYSPEVGEVVEQLGFKWIILDESAVPRGEAGGHEFFHPEGRAEVARQQFSRNQTARLRNDIYCKDSLGIPQKLGGLPARQIYKKKNSDLAVFFRDRKLSLAIAFSEITSISQLLAFFEAEGYSLDDNCPARHRLSPQATAGGYIILAMDAETFGHHQPRQLKFLEEILEWNMKHGVWGNTSDGGRLKRSGSHDSSEVSVPIKFVTLSELLDLFPKTQEIEPKASTWGDSWKRWDNPRNPIHKLQWKLYKLALSCGGSPLKRRNLLDRALHSDQFWWASHNPCWHPKMIEKGARMLQDVVLLSSLPEKEKEEAKKLYNKIILTGRKLYGEEIIPC